MSRPFDITTTNDTASTTVGSSVRLVFTVSNTMAKPLRGTLRARALDSGQAAWVSVAGDAERDFPAGFTHQVEVTVKIPSDAVAGKFRVRIDALSVANPDDDFTEGPAVSITINAAEVKKSSSMWWIWVIVAVVVLALIGVVTWVVLRKEAPPPAPVVTPEPVAPAKPVGQVPPNLIGLPVADAVQQLKAAGFATAKESKDITDGCPDDVIATDPVPGSNADAGATVKLVIGKLPSGPDTCKMGFVWRDAFPGDTVCVTGESRERARVDNALNPQRTELVEATPKDFEAIQRENPNSRAVPKGDFQALKPYAADRLIYLPNRPLIAMVSRCKPGFTERRARAQDRVCVTEATQIATDDENKQAESRKACSR